MASCLATDDSIHLDIYSDDRFLFFNLTVGHEFTSLKAPHTVSATEVDALNCGSLFIALRQNASFKKDLLISITSLCIHQCAISHL